MQDNKISNNLSDSGFLQQLATACFGLVWLSESDFPWQVVCWSNTESLSSQILLQYYNYAPKTKLRTTILESFFAPVTVEQEWYDQSEINQARRYQLLQKLLQDNLREVRVYLVGEVTVDVYILGMSETKQVAGLSTKIIET